MTRRSPSEQNQSGKSEPKTPLGGDNQQVPQRAGNPRFNNPGLDPSTDPKIVVKAVNPPVTPDQVVGMAEMPSAATLDLPRIQNIKIPPVKNKTIQGHLKAIEAKMNATEKLMKDVVKLQKVQILTEKELFERKRELYQNTFEEYLLDKTVDFEDPDAQGGGSKKPKLPGGGGFPFGGGRRGGGRGGGGRGTGESPVTETKPKPGTDGEGAKVKPGQQPELDDVVPPRREKPDFEPGFVFPDLLKLLPLIFGPLLNPEIANNVDPTTPLTFSTPRDQMEEFLRSGEFDPISQAAAPALTPEEATRQLTEEIEGQQTAYKPFEPVKEQPVSPDPVAVNPLDRILKGFTDPPSLSEVTGLPISEDLEMALETVTMLQGGGALKFGATTATQAPAIAQTVRRLGVPFVSRVPGLKRLFGLSDDVAEITVKAGKAGTSAADDVAATTTAVPQTPPAGGMTARQRALMRGGSRQNLGGRVKSRRLRPDSKTNPPKTVQSEAAFRQQQGDAADAGLRRITGMSPGQKVNQGQSTNALERSRALAERAFRGSGARVTEELDGITNITNAPKASGGMGDVELFNSDALNYFRGMSSKIVPMADGGLVGWWNKGRNMRVPSESTASWKDLMKDDAKQLTRTNKAFKSGATGMKGWNPIKAFTPEMVRTGPTPAVRQAFERPVRTVTHPLMMALEFIVNDLLLNPRSTAVYDQVTGPNAYYNDPAYKGPMPSQNLENAQSSMMSGNNDQKPEVVPLPPDYIKIPGKKKAPDFVGDDSPDIFMRTSIFTRNQTDLD